MACAVHGSCWPQNPPSPRSPDWRPPSDCGRCPMSKRDRSTRAKTLAVHETSWQNKATSSQNKMRPQPSKSCRSLADDQARPPESRSRSAPSPKRYQGSRISARARHCGPSRWAADKETRAMEKAISTAQMAIPSRQTNNRPKARKRSNSGPRLRRASDTGPSSAGRTDKARRQELKRRKRWPDNRAKCS